MTIRPRFGFVVEYVPDVEAAKRFYEDVVGLEVQRYHPTFVQFDTFAIAGDQPMTGSGEPEMYWLVDDAEVAFKEMSNKATVKTPLQEMAFGKTFGIEDPAGRPIFMLELSRNRPSQEVG